MMMFELFNEAARKVLLHATDEASALGHQAIMPAIADTGTADAEILQSIGIDLQSVRRQAEVNFGPGALDRPRPRRTGLFRSRPRGGAMPYTNDATRALEKSLQEAQALRSSSIGTEHILLGLLADEQDPAPRTLRQLGADPARIRETILGKLPRSA